MIIVLMGVSGCGKSAIGQALSKELDIPFYDADDFHSEANKRKMKEGTPLTDRDRKPWLKTLADFMGAHGKRATTRDSEYAYPACNRFGNA